MTVHVFPSGESGSRFYLHARNLAGPWLYLSWPFEFMDPATYPCYDRPDRWHIVAEREVTNTETVEIVAGILGVEPRIEKVNFQDTTFGMP